MIRSFSNGEEGEMHQGFASGRCCSGSCGSAREAEVCLWLRNDHE